MANKDNKVLVTTVYWEDGVVGRYVEADQTLPEGAWSWTGDGIEHLFRELMTPEDANNYINKFTCPACESEIATEAECPICGERIFN